MINANLEQFLDTGWFSEATLYYNGHTYWCEGGWDRDEHKEKPFGLVVYRYKAILVKSNDEIFSRRAIENGDVADYSTVFDMWGYGEDDVKEAFLNAKIFDGKSFWEVEKEIAWYDEF